MGVRCVKCDGHNTAAYIYGMPKLDEKLERDIDEHKAILVNSEVTDFDPKFHCKDCKKDFGYSAKRLCNGMITDYIEQTVYYFFSLNYADYGETRFILYKENDNYFVELYGCGKNVSKEISEAEYKKNLATIFEKAYVLEWDEKYDRNDPVDINNWKIEIKCDNGKTFTSSGRNYFPPYFRKAKTRHDHYIVKYILEAIPS